MSITAYIVDESSNFSEIMFDIDNPNDQEINDKLGCEFDRIEASNYFLYPEVAVYKSDTSDKFFLIGQVDAAGKRKSIKLDDTKKRNILKAIDKYTKT